MTGEAIGYVVVLTDTDGVRSLWCEELHETKREAEESRGYCEEHWDIGTFTVESVGASGSVVVTLGDGRVAMIWQTEDYGTRVGFLPVEEAHNVGEDVGDWQAVEEAHTALAELHFKNPESVQALIGILSRSLTRWPDFTTVGASGPRADDGARIEGCEIGTMFYDDGVGGNSVYVGLPPYGPLHKMLGHRATLIILPAAPEGQDT